MRPVKKRLMELNPEKGEEERYQRAVVEIGEHISSSLLQWTHLEDRAQWKRYSLSPPPPPPPTHTHTHTHTVVGICGYLSPSSPAVVLMSCTDCTASGE